jgi:hypothetical protein
VSRWLNDTQVKIKSEVAASNQYAKALYESVAQFEKAVKESKVLKHREVVRLIKQRVFNFHMEKAFILKPYDPDQFFESFDTLNKEIHNRAVYLKCLKEGLMAHDLKVISEENFERQKSPMIGVDILLVCLSFRFKPVQFSPFLFRQPYTTSFLYRARIERNSY